MPNHLAGEASRYLQQHAENPVAWYPWGDEALERARREDKPIFLSIGYSACHWCHVMAHESFEDEATAEILNEHFISIKVDREERPDLDRIYMGAVQAMTGSGGWPMSVFITPEGIPFYGGTYFPKEPRFNMPAFASLLRAIAEAWEDRREELLRNGEQLVAALRQQLGFGDADTAEIGPSTVEQAYWALQQRFDARHGGWGSAPKFPQSMVMEFLLCYYHTSGDRQALTMVSQTLQTMALGGVYDQLGGGFHRYAVDATWLTPHFERMLYDNAQLARVYLHALQVLDDDSRITNSNSQDSDDRTDLVHDEGLPQLFRAVIEETLDYVMREMTAPEGGFYATQDADSEGEEGKFFTWTASEIRDALGGPATRFLELYGVTEKGNFEGRNILTFKGTFAERQAISGGRQRLFGTREQRPHPGRDEKVLTSWNGLMLAAFAEAARVLGREDYRQVAERNADFLLREMRSVEGRLHHVSYDGEASIQGLLEDYTYLIEGLIALYQTTFELRWVVAATDLADEMISHFGATSDDGKQVVGFYDTADDVESLVVRPHEMQDNAVPSGNAMAATVLQKLARLSGETRYEDIAVRGLVPMQSLMAQYPLGFGQWLVALDSALAVPVEVAIVGDPAAGGTRALIDAARASYAPHRLLAVGSGRVPEILAHREQVNGLPTAYVCRNRVCLPPVTEPDRLRELLS